MPRQDPIAEKFFGKEKESAVGFEITLAALLATLALTYPVPGRRILSEGAAFLILVVTLLRRISMASPFAPEEKIQGVTNVCMEFATVFTLLSIFSGLSAQIQLPLISGTIANFGLLTFLTFLAIALLHEFVFRDYFVWWHAKFGQRANSQDSEDNLWRDLSVLSYAVSSARRNREAWKELPSRTTVQTPSIEDYDINKGALIKAFLRLSIVLLLLYSIPLIAAFLLVGPAGILLVLTVVAIHDQSRFWYIAYGNASYEDFVRRIWVKIFVTTLLIGASLVYLPSATITIPFV